MDAPRRRHPAQTYPIDPDPTLGLARNKFYLDPEHRGRKRGRGDESFGFRRKEQVVELSSRRYHNPNTIILNRDSEEEGDVIDLGAPRCCRPVSAQRPPRLYTPNPRLYPGPKTKSKATRHNRRSARTEDSRPRQRKRKFTQPVPNSRLYRPSPPKPPHTALRPPAAWPLPENRAFESASRAALRVLKARRLRVHEPSPGPSPPVPLIPHTARSSRLVVTLPAAGDARSAMATHKHSTSPDCSDGNDPSSAPSEFLAEFLSAIMRQQYAEALKYCQLILQYEPHNATARGFYPLLRHKLRAQDPPRASPSLHTLAAREESSSSGGTSPRPDKLLDPQLKQQSAEAEGSAEGSGSEEMEQGSGSGSGSGSGACSSLELDSSEARSAPTSPRRTDTTDPSDSSSWRWDSGGSHSERDDNGNPAPRIAADDMEGAEADVRNDNSLLQAQSSSMSSLQRLRAHFACSIK